MKRCPKCNCGAEFTNKAEYYAVNVGAYAAGLAVGGVVGVVSPNHATHAGHAVTENLSKNQKKHYKCTNGYCNYEWDD